MKSLPLGLRTLKTGLAVILSLLLVRLITDDALCSFYAAFGALVGLDTTLSRSLRQGLTQLVGVLLGTVLSYGSLVLYPTEPPALLVGLGIILLITLGNLLRVQFSISLACIVFLSACLTPTEDVLVSSLMRMTNTTLGVAVALVINVLLRPYNNRRRIISLLVQVRSLLTEQLAQILVREQYPDLTGAVLLLRQLDQELRIYHSQRLFHRKEDEEALLSGCRQLADRMLQELEAICGMDCLGDIQEEQQIALNALGICPPMDTKRKCSLQDTMVMNYHLEKLLAARSYLTQLLGE